MKGTVTEVRKDAEAPNKHILAPTNEWWLIKERFLRIRLNKF